MDKRGKSLQYINSCKKCTNMVHSINLAAAVGD